MLGDLTFNPPASFNLFGIEIYYYGVIIAVAFLVGILYCSKNSRKFNIAEDDVYDVLIWMIPLSVIGARLYYVVFNLDYYLSDPSLILAIRDGGLAIYGGIITAAIVVAVICKKKNIPFLRMADMLFTVTLLCQAIGRWGNFMNREAFGYETDIFCRMGLTSPDGTTIYVHPTFLYESLWNLTGFILINHIVQTDKRRYDGECTYLYLVWYGLGRFFIEGLRTDSLYIGSTGIRASQALSTVMVIAGSILLFINHKKLKSNNCENNNEEIISENE